MTTPQSAVALQVGDKAPEFTANAHPAGTHSLKEYAGKKNVVLAFYPKDDTPGCTKEMCAFSADLSKFNDANTQVFGISCDNTDSHEKFAQKHSLTLPLLADDTCEIGRKYGVVREDKKTAERVLFVIDKNGVIRHIHNGMPSNDELLNVLKTLK